MSQIPQINAELNPTTYFSKLSANIKSTLGEKAFVTWLEQLGIQSRITYKHILKGRRTLDVLKFKKMLDLSFQEASDFDRLANEENKTPIPNSTQTYAVSSDFFATPVNTIILNLCGIKDSMKAEDIQNILRGAFSEQEINASIELLIKESLIVQQDTGRLVRIFEGILTTLPGLRSVSSQQYFEKVNRLADQAWHMPIQQREMHSFTMRIDHRDLPRLKDLVRKFRADCSSLSAPENRDSVYQCSVSAFPVYLNSQAD